MKRQVWLTKSREEARTLVSQQMNEGQAMLSSLERLVDPNEVEQKLKLWTEYNCELIRSLFNDSTLADEYLRSQGDWVKARVLAKINKQPLGVRSVLKKEISSHLLHLQSIVKRMDLIPEAALPQLHEEGTGKSDNHTPETWYRNRTIQATMITAFVSIVGWLVHVYVNKPSVGPEFTTEGHWSPEIVTSGPNSPVTVNYSSPDSSVAGNSGSTVSQVMRDSPGGVQIAGDVHIHKAQNSVGKPIGKATATVEVVIKSDDHFDGIAANVRAYLAFMKGQTPLLTTGVIGYRARQKGNGEVAYQANLTMDAGDSAVGQPVSLLRQTDYILLTFGRMPPGSQVLGGRALCTVNDLNIEFSVPEQVADGTRIFLRNIAGPLQVLNQGEE